MKPGIHMSIGRNGMSKTGVGGTGVMVVSMHLPKFHCQELGQLPRMDDADEWDLMYGLSNAIPRVGAESVPGKVRGDRANGDCILTSVNMLDRIE